MKTLIGTKIGMTRIIGENGEAIPVTIIQAGPCTVTQVKTSETDGYNAVQLGFGNAKNLSKSVQGHVKQAKVTPKVLQEVRIENVNEELAVGSEVNVSAFAVGDMVDVTGTSKGKGFAGVVKRHNFRTTKETHGGNGYVRRPGSIGSMYPQKVFKGKKMPGRMGAERTTVKNLQVALVDVENNILGLKGAVPGPRRGVLRIGGVA